MKTGSVSLLDPSREPEWDRFVENHPCGLISHLSGWKEALEKSFRHIKGYFLVLSNPVTGEIRAGLPVYLVRSCITGRRLVSVPFATLCTPLATSREEVQELLSEVIDLSQRLSARRIEVRALAPAALMQDLRYERLDFFKHHYLQLDVPAEQLMKRFHKKSVRSTIRCSERSGFELRSGSSTEDVERFFGAYQDTRQRLGLPPQPFRLFTHFAGVFGPAGRFNILTAFHGGAPAAGMVLFKFRDRVFWEFIGEHYAFRHLHPTHFLLWQAIKQSCEEGYRIFDFGRTSPNNFGLMDFKRRWGTVTADLPQFWFPVNSNHSFNNAEKTIKHRLVRTFIRKLPPRLLRVLGEVCYQQMG